jgi:hypothetical protein
MVTLVSHRFDLKGVSAMSDRVPHPGVQHPPRWHEDLNPTAMAGANYGIEGPHPERDARIAYDYKDVHRSLASLSDDELRSVPILPAGAQLEQGATYFDLAEPCRGEFTATGDMTVAQQHRLVLESKSVTTCGTGLPAPACRIAPGDRSTRCLPNRPMRTT